MNMNITFEDDQDFEDKSVVPVTVSKEFIEVYRKFQFLWNPRHVFYNNKLRRVQAYDALTEVLRKAIPNATRDSVRKHINVIRTNFSKEHKKVLASRQIVNGKYVAKYVPRSWRYKELIFLADIVNNKHQMEIEMSQQSMNASHQEIALTEEEEEEEYELSMPEDPDMKDEPIEEIAYMTTGQHVFNGKKRRRTNEEIELGDLPNISREEYNAIGTNITLKLKRMNEDQRYLAELLIHKVLINGLKNKLNDVTDLQGLTCYLEGTEEFEVENEERS